MCQGSDSVSFTPVVARQFCPPPHCPLSSSPPIPSLRGEGLEVLPRSRRRGETCCQHLSSALILLSREGRAEWDGGKGAGVARCGVWLPFGKCGIFVYNHQNTNECQYNVFATVASDDELLGPVRSSFLLSNIK